MICKLVPKALGPFGQYVGTRIDLDIGINFFYWSPAELKEADV